MSGMGGMGARGGMGRGGMRGMGGSAPRRESPLERAKKTIEDGNPLKLLLDHKKPLALTKAQQDTFKSYEQELKEMQSPLFKSLEQLASAGGSGGAGRGGMAGGGRGGGRGGLGGGMPGDEGGDDGARGRRGGFLPDTAKRLLDRLVDIQDAYHDRAWAKLDSTQRVRVDSIQEAKLAKEREKAEKERDKERKAMEERRGR